MKILNFESLEDFNKLFEKDSRMITDEIVKSIEEALNFQKGTAKLFTISISNEEHSFEVTLPKSQWEAAKVEATEAQGTFAVSLKALRTSVFIHECSWGSL